MRALGIGGDAPVGSTRGKGGNITLQPGSTGAGAGTAGNNGNVLIAPTAVGNVGIGTNAPTSKLTVAGGDIQIVTAGRGVKFSDASVQTTAGLPAVQHNATLSGAGTAAIPLTVANLGVGNAQLANGAVNGAKIANLAVGNAQLANGAVNGAKIANSAVGNAQLADGAVNGAKIAVPLTLSGIAGVAILTVLNGSGDAISTFGAISTSKQYNIGGQRVLVSNNGSANTFAGIGAGAANPTGTSNAFFGTSAGAANTSGFQNSFFGDGAGRANTTAPSNSFFGRLAGRVNTDGNTNSFFGTFAGDSNTSGDRNVFLGANAGEANTVGNSNTIVGTDADVGANNLTNATAIGNQAQVNTSNSLILGSVQNVPVGALATKVGIGTTAPTHRLTIGQPEVPVVPTALVGVYGAGSAYSIVRDTTHNVEGLFGADNSPTLNSLGTVISNGAAIFGSASNHVLQFRTNNITRMTIFSGSGFVDMADDLIVNGSITVRSLPSGGSVHLCTIANIISNCSSSIRYKTDVRSFTPGLDLLNHLRPVSFRWKRNGEADLGLIAEEVERVEPLLVTRNDKGAVEGVKYERLGVVLLNAVKEQQAQIKQQETQIEQLQARLAQVERTVKKRRAARKR